MSTQNDPSVGPLHEDTVSQALRHIQDEKIPIAHSTIVSFTQSKSYSPEDMHGVDFRLEMEHGISMPLQVKSCEHAKRKFERYGKMHKAFVPVIVITGLERLEEIVSKLRDLLANAIKFFIRQKNKIICNERRKKAKRFRYMQSASGCTCH